MTLLIPSKRLARLPRGLTAYWPLDASTCEFGSGQVRPLDLIGNNYGVDAKSPGASGGPPFDGGGIGYNFAASNTTTYIKLNADPLQGNGVAKDLTIALWLNARSYNNSDSGGVPNSIARILSFSTDIIVALDNGTSGTGFSAGTIEVDGIAGHSSSIAAIGVWTHLAITAVGGSAVAKIYLNGVDVTVALGSGNAGSAGVWGLGCRDPVGGSGRVMDGKMAHAMVCLGTALSAGEIADLYSSFFVAEEVMPALFTPAAPPAFLVAAVQSWPSLGRKVEIIGAD